MAKRDLITKDFALYVVHYFNAMQTWSKKDILSEIDRTIKEAKPEDAVPVVHAKWECIMDFGSGDCLGYCSNCHTEHKAENVAALKAGYRHCRWCGARMDGE